MGTTQGLYCSDTRFGFTDRILELLQARELLWYLAWRDIKARYKQSVLGLAWAMFVPLAMMLVFTFIFTRVMILELDVPYALFAYCGLLPWNFFATSTTAATNSLVANRTLVTKVYFPAEVLPLSCILTAFVDFLTGCTIFIALMALYGFQNLVVVSWTALLGPGILLIQIALTTGLSLLLAMGNLFFRDVRYIYSVLVMLWMFASPVVYPLSTSDPTARFVLSVNPMVPLLDAYRDVLLRGRAPDWTGLGYALGVAVTLLLAAWMLFCRLQYRFAERV